MSSHLQPPFAVRTGAPAETSLVFRRDPVAPRVHGGLSPLLASDFRALSRLAAAHV